MIELCLFYTTRLEMVLLPAMKSKLTGDEKGDAYYELYDEIIIWALDGSWAKRGQGWEGPTGQLN